MDVRVKNLIIKFHRVYRIVVVVVVFFFYFVSSLCNIYISYNTQISSLFPYRYSILATDIALIEPLLNLLLATLKLKNIILI